MERENRLPNYDNVAKVFEKISPLVDPSLARLMRIAGAQGALAASQASARDPEIWNKHFKIVVLYLCTNATFPDLASKFGYKYRTCASLAFRSFIVGLHRNLPPEFQQEFDLAKIKFGKRASQKRKDQLSRVNGGRRKEIRLMVASGASSPAEIASRLGLESSSVLDAMGKMRRQGLIPESRITRNGRLVATILRAETPREIAEVLGQSNKSFIARHHDLFSTVSSIARGAGYTFNNQRLEFFIATLRQSAVPIKTIPRRVEGGQPIRSKVHYVLKQQLREVLVAFETNPDLMRFRQGKTVGQVAGPPVRSPSHRKSRDRNLFKTLSAELREIGVRKDKVFNNCPVPVFRYERGYVVRVGDFQALMEHARKVKQIGNGKNGTIWPRRVTGRIGAHHDRAGLS